ncbi:MAG: hypothetical protein R3279_13480 [Putridiphycobacter sp.]|nr:hypothetical protein [Putridiphycobacter sp.]
MSEKKKKLKFEAIYCDTLKKNPNQESGFLIDIPITDYNHLKLIRTSLYEAIEALTDRQEHSENVEDGVNYSIYWIHYLLKHTELESEYEGLSEMMK